MAKSNIAAGKEARNADHCFQQFHSADEIVIYSCTACMLHFQGKEDLHTDERLGQFLRAAGAALRGGSGGDLGGLEIHTFGVTPVARRVGLVQVKDA